MSEEEQTRRSPTMMDIARECGISPSAVSHALRGGNGEVSEATRKRVIIAAEEMGYDLSHNLSARRMALHRFGSRPLNHAIGFTMPETFHDAVFYLKIMRGVMDAAGELSYGVHLTTNNILEASLPSVLTNGEVDGLLMLRGPLWSIYYAERLRAEPNFGDRPIISLLDPVPGYSAVQADDYTAGYQAALHLLNLGHRNIVHNFAAPAPIAPGIVGGDSDVVSKRLRGIRQACRDHGLDPEQTLHYSFVPHLDTQIDEYGPQLVGLLTSNPTITALIAPNDFAAVQIWRTLVKAGLRVPADISMVSFDDTDAIYSPDGDNILTTVRIPLREIGRESTKLLIRSISGDVQSAQNIVLPTELIIRQSTTPPRSVR